MATEYTQAEIDAIFEQYNKEMADAGKVTAETARAFKDAQVGVKNYTYNLNQSLKQLGTSVKGIAKDLASGETGASIFNNSIKSGADAVADYTSKMGIQGKILGMAIKAGAAYVAAVNKQADALYKSYQNISRAGAIGAGGMTEVFTRLKAFGYGIKELDQMASLLKENSKILSSFGGTAFDGARQFAQLADTLQHSNLTAELQKMGLSVDEINQGAAGYIKMQTMLGRNSTDNQKNLTQETVKYIEQLEAITRLTGLSRQEQEQRMADAMREGAFARKMSVEQAKYDEATAKGDEVAAEKHRKEIEKLNVINMTLEGEMRQQAMAAVMGDVSRSQKLFLTAGSEAVMAITDPTKSAGDMLNLMTKGMQRNIDTMGDMAGYGDTYNKNFIPLNESLAFTAKLRQKDAEQQIADAKLQSKANDSATDNMIGMGIAQRKSRDAMEEFVNAGIKPVTSAMELLAKVIENLTRLIPFSGSAKKKLEDEKKDKGAVSTVGGSVLEKLAATGIKNKTAQANILAQIQAESGGKPKTESLNYQPGQLLKTFPKKFKDLADAQAVVAQGEEAVGNRIYGNRMGNAANEGYKYRGRGLIQLTGKDNYKKFGKLLGIDLVGNPELANDPEVAKNIAVAYFREKEKQGTDLADIYQVNRAVGFVGNNDYSYGGQARQRVLSAQQIEKNLPSAAFGGILSGPTDGFKAMLHGTEAVVPLPDGRKIPVEMPGWSNSMTEQNSMLSTQIAKLDQLIGVMQNQVNISKQILSHTH